MSSSSSSSLSSSGCSLSQQPDHYLSPTDQLCYLNCNFCFTVLAVSVPCSSLFKTVTIRCGHCSNILTANILPSSSSSSPANHHHLQLGHSFFTPPPPPQNLLEEIRSAPTPTMLQINHHPISAAADSVMQFRGGGGGGIMDHPLQHPPLVNRPPEKRQRVPSAYNRFIKEEIQRIKAGNPDISHREAFSAAAKNWAHFPHIHFGLMPDQPVKKPTTMCQQEGEDLIMRKDGLFAPANLGVSPY